jgi:ribosomal-protein-alanine N-acetyltransferase
MPSYSDLALRTERLDLRCFRHADATSLFAIFSSPDVSRYLARGRWTQLDEAHQRIARDINGTAAGEYLRLAFERREDGRVVGECCLFNFVHACRRAEIGYALARDAWGFGLAGEALRALVDQVRARSRQGDRHRVAGHVLRDYREHMHSNQPVHSWD